MRTLVLGIIAAIAVGSYTSNEPLHTTVQEGVLNAANWAWIMATREKSVDVSEVALYSKLRYNVWGDMCYDYRKVSCAGIAVPKIARFSKSPFRPNLQGFYDGSDTVYIRSDLRGAEREEVLAHEMSHYWDVMVLEFKVPGPAREICESEKYAWAVSDAFWVSQGYSPTGSKMVGSDWTKWYKHCTPFHDELYPEGD